ncbi:hypothetical protein ACFYZ8_09575 [Streptomyces sp. NPDC001668]|uniref:hypothetical protein n=1 Tax=unclassified Streptomyces TaxID=2593676 RepID=UPI00369C4D45
MCPFGLLTFVLFGWSRLDPLAGFFVAAFVIMEGKEAWEGELVCDDGKSAVKGTTTSCSDGCN